MLSLRHQQAMDACSGIRRHQEQSVRHQQAMDALSQASGAISYAQLSVAVGSKAQRVAYSRIRCLSDEVKAPAQVQMST